MKVPLLVKRFMFPQIVISLYYYLKYGTKMSFRSEVDLTGNLTFGKKCVVSSFTKIKALQGCIHIGKEGGFATGCFVSSGSAGIYIGDNFLCGPNVSITGSNFVYNRLNERVHSSRGIKIGNNVWVGANSSIVDGAEISDNTVVYANTVVNRKFQPNVVLQGCPAKVVFEMKGQKSREKDDK